MSDRDKKREGESPPSASGEKKKKPSNVAPDAVKDPSEKTDGKPGVPEHGNETDPGAG